MLMQAGYNQMVRDFDSLYHAHEPLVRRTLARILPVDDLDDAVQETFTKVFLKLGDFEGKSKPETWIVRIAINTAHDMNRRRLRLSKLLTSWFDFQKLYPREKGDPLELQNFIMNLPFRERTLLILFFQEGYTQEEAAEILSIPVGTVKSRLYAIRKKFRKNYQTKGVI